LEAVLDGVDRAEGVIVPPWLRDDVPAEHRDLAVFVAEIGADHDRPRTSVERWQTLRRAQAEIAAGPLAAVTRADVRAWWFGRGQFRAGGTPRSPATRRAMRDHLRAFVAWAIDRELRTDDPLRGLPTVRVPRREPRPADRAEVDRVLATADGSARTAVILAADLGLRCCEIATVTRDDLQHLDGGWWLWLTRKGGHRLRCAVPVTLAAELATTGPGQPLVPSRLGGHLTARGVSDLIARTFARAGSSIRAHALRHLAATELLAATGGDIAVVAEQLGHRNTAPPPVTRRSTAAASPRHSTDCRPSGYRRRPLRRHPATAIVRALSHRRRALPLCPRHRPRSTTSTRPPSRSPRRKRRGPCGPRPGPSRSRGTGR
jgi:integrase